CVSTIETTRTPRTAPGRSSSSFATLTSDTFAGVFRNSCIGTDQPSRRGGARDTGPGLLTLRKIPSTDPEITRSSGEGSLSVALFNGDTSDVPGSDLRTACRRMVAIQSASVRLLYREWNLR